MIDKNELNTLLNHARIIMLARIQRLSEAAGLIDEIEQEIYGRDTIDEIRLMALIKPEYYYRQKLKDLDGLLARNEEKIWARLLCIDKPKED